MICVEHYIEASVVVDDINTILLASIQSGAIVLRGDNVGRIRYRYFHHVSDPLGASRMRCAEERGGYGMVPN